MEISTRRYCYYGESRNQNKTDQAEPSIKTIRKKTNSSPIEFSGGSEVYSY